MPEIGFLETLPPLQRLALSYAPAGTRAALLALFALDLRLAAIVRNSYEPMLAQLRLAWWREQLALAPASRPQGDPLLAALGDWPGNAEALVGLVHGWEALTGPAPLPAASFVRLAEARAHAFAALADAGEAAQRMGRNWALLDIAVHLSHPQEREAVLELARAQDWRWTALPRGLRPLAVLHGVAARQMRQNDVLSAPSLGALLTAMRIGWLGR